MELDVHPVLLRPAEGEGEAIVDTPNRELRILCDHEWLNATWTRHASGERGAEPHIHLHHVDAFYVLAGEMTLRLGPELEQLTAGAGTLVLVPPGLVHAFDNDSDGELRFLNFHAPGCNFVAYLRGRGEFDQAPPPEDGGRPASDAIVTPPDGGKRVERGDRAVTIVGELPEISVLRLEVEQWPRIPVHDHDDQVDSFFVLEGEAGLVQGGEIVRAAAGSFYVAAPGARHGFENLGDPVTLLNVHGPDAGFAEDVRSQ